MHIGLVSKIKAHRPHQGNYTDPSLINFCAHNKTSILKNVAVILFSEYIYSFRERKVYYIKTIKSV
jgi:hypothetical protein